MSQLFASGGQSIGVSSFNISPSNDHSGLISFRMEWLDLLAVQRTFKLLQITIINHQNFNIIKKFANLPVLGNKPYFKIF